MEEDVPDQENDNIRTDKTPIERKLCYRNLLNRVEDIHEREDLGFDTIKEIGIILKEGNALQAECDIDDRVEHADETLLDAMVLSSASTILVKTIQAVDVLTSTYEPSKFSNMILNYISQGDPNDIVPEQILKLMPDVNRVIPCVAPYHFTFGSYDLNKEPQPKEKKQRQKKDKTVYEKKKPEKVTALEEDSKEIDAIVKALYDVLQQEYANNDNQPIKYYDYVIDTDSFTTTLENSFYCSFLIRDGKAHIDLVRGEPYIKPMTKKKLKEHRDQGGSNAQMISTIRFTDWAKHKKEGFLQLFKNK